MNSQYENIFKDSRKTFLTQINISTNLSNVDYIRRMAVFSSIFFSFLSWSQPGSLNRRKLRQLLSFMKAIQLYLKPIMTQLRDIVSHYFRYLSNNETLEQE